MLQRKYFSNHTNFFWDISLLYHVVNLNAEGLVNFNLFLSNKNKKRQRLSYRWSYLAKKDKDFMSILFRLKNTLVKVGVVVQAERFKLGRKKRLKTKWADGKGRSTWTTYPYPRWSRYGTSWSSGGQPQRVVRFVAAVKNTLPEIVLRFFVVAVKNSLPDTALKQI